MNGFWKDILLGHEELKFLPEILLRTLVMYILILVSLRLLGKRGVKQLSVFELVVIISLGSAAGDPMFYNEVGLLAAVAVFLVVIGAYRLTTYLVAKSDVFEKMVEGTCTELIRNGCFSVRNFKKEPLAYDEFFSELRQYSISHLGQVELAIIETSGNISVFYYPDDKVQYGLPILPHLFAEKTADITKKGRYACAFCGCTFVLDKGKHKCEVCKKDSWVTAINTPRIT
ncbi:DUF421 domain-containing protein [Mucilaginibacter hurinus]|uniref:DUF421 domain-containing protein n=1 Tax=Mucilaginibacter hurinus TaxID=2201324 RepID=A0A367GPN6_9SPHI|nr:DUF421 domain-containing protein [Mucilaginibacter hurinus]RCH55424.1 DUF421 domain-containing protein [Mucilaginibacter hurinus]